MIHNSRGMTLIELMVGVGISSILAVIVTSMLTAVTGQSNSAMDSADFENNMNRMEYLINREFRLAVNMVDIELPTTWQDSGGISATGQGAMHSFDSTNANVASISPATDLLNNHHVSTLAYFLRENNTVTSASTDPVRSVYIGTGVYFQQPSTSTYGVMYINQGDATNGTTVASTLSAKRTGIMIYPLTFVQIPASKITYTSSSGQNFVNSFQIVLGTRALGGVSGNKAAQTWCPPSAVAGSALYPYAVGTTGYVMGASPCLTDMQYRDFVRTFTITLRNNVDPTSLNLASMISGRAYFMK